MTDTTKTSETWQHDLVEELKKRVQDSLVLVGGVKIWSVIVNTESSTTYTRDSIDNYKVETFGVVLGTPDYSGYYSKGFTPESFVTSIKEDGYTPIEIWSSGDVYTIEVSEEGWLEYKKEKK